MTCNIDDNLVDHCKTIHEREDTETVKENIKFGCDLCDYASAT